MILNQGADIFRDAMADKCKEGRGGVDDSVPEKIQTSLVDGVVASTFPINVTKTTSAWQTAHVIPSTAATSNTFVEWAVKDSNGVAITRSVTAGINHTSADDLVKITTFEVRTS